MTPATNHPHISVSPAGSLKTLRPPVAGARHNTPTHRDSNFHADVSTRREPHPVGNTLVDAEFVGSPYCERCGTDEFIYLETFVPAKFRHDGTLRKPGEVTYFCSGCEDFSAHSVPASWVPPGWYFG